MNHSKTTKLTQTALLSAIVIIIQVFLSSIKIGPVTLSFVLVPIVIASVIVGPAGGLFVGLVSGITTMIQVFTSGDPFYIMLMSVSPLFTALTCLIKTTLAGWLSGELYKIISSNNKHKAVKILLPAAVCPVVNTGIFCLFMILFFKDGICDLLNLPSEKIVYIVFILLAGINFVIEFILNIILCPIIGKAIFSSKKVTKQA